MTILFVILTIAAVIIASRENSKASKAANNVRILEGKLKVSEEQGAQHLKMYNDAKATLDKIKAELEMVKSQQDAKEAAAKKPTRKPRAKKAPSKAPAKKTTTRKTASKK